MGTLAGNLPASNFGGNDKGIKQLGTVRGVNQGVDVVRAMNNSGSCYKGGTRPDAIAYEPLEGEDVDTTI